MIYKVLDISSLTDEDYEKAYSRISESRRNKTDRYKLYNDRRRSVFAYTLALDMLCEFLDCDDNSLEFDLTETGKPVLKNGNAHFNISHSGNFVACAVSRSPVGIDIEAPHPVDDKLITRVCTEQEIKFVMQSDGEKISRFFALWTAKEAYLKYTGKGLSGGVNTVQTADENGIFATFKSGQKLINKITSDYILSVVHTE